MKRFKTKQELVVDYGKHNPFSKDCKFGEPATNDDLCHRFSNNFTDAPHPYEGVSIKMKINPEQSKKVQEKAFKLGYGWGAAVTAKVEYSTDPFIYLDSHKHLSHGYTSTFFNQHSNIELTPEQFLEGYMPEKSQTEEEINALYNGKLLEEMKNFDNPYQIKKDAYVVEEGLLNNTVKLIVNEDGEVIQDLKYLHQYNLMSSEAFKAKHEPDKLKFKQWEVKVDEKHVRMHCHGNEHAGEPFKKDTLALILRVVYIMDNHDVTPNELYKFLNKNRIKLGI